MTMELRKIEIQNLLGIEQRTIEPGSVTVFEGRNGVGKTSTLDALRWLLVGGSDPSLLRKGAAKGSVRATAADGTVISRTLTSKGATLTVELPNLGRVSKPQTFLDRLVGDSLAFDPLALLSVRDDRRAEMLRDLIRPTVAPDQLAAVAGVTLTSVGATANPFDVLDAARARHYDARTAANSIARQARATIETLTPGSEMESGPAPDLAELRKKVNRISDERHVALKVVSDRESEETKDASSRHHDLILTIKDARELRLGTIRKEAEARIAAIRSEQAAAEEEARSAAMREIAQAGATLEREETTAQEAARQLADSIKSVTDQQLQAAREELSRAEERAAAHSRAAGVRQTIEAQRRIAEENESRSAALTRQLDDIDAFKLKLLESLPIRGLTVVDGDVQVDGTPWRHVNTGRLYEVMAEIACLRAGELGLIIMDRTESLDPQAFERFKTACGAMGRQVLLARVTDGEFSISE